MMFFGEENTSKDRLNAQLFLRKLAYQKLVVLQVEHCVPSVHRVRKNISQYHVTLPQALTYVWLVTPLGEKENIPCLTDPVDSRRFGVQLVVYEWSLVNIVITDMITGHCRTCGAISDWRHKSGGRMSYSLGVFVGMGYRPLEKGAHYRVCLEVKKRN